MNYHVCCSVDKACAKLSAKRAPWLPPFAELLTQFIILLVPIPALNLCGEILHFDCKPNVIPVVITVQASVALGMPRVSCFAWLCLLGHWDA